MTKYKRRAIAVLVSGICAGGATLAVADNPHSLPGRLGGLINDYTPASVNGGPYEMRGKWSLDVHRKSGTANFSAVMNMETSDWGISKGIVNPDDPSTRGAHTHHITMTKATVTLDSSICPALSPATSGGFVVTGTAQVNGNGTPGTLRVRRKPALDGADLRHGGIEGRALELHTDVPGARDRALRDPGHPWCRHLHLVQPRAHP